MKTVSRPPITPRGEEKVFYDRLRDHELVYQQCSDCQAVIFPLRVICTTCSREQLELHVSRGVGTVYSFTTQHRPSHPFFADDVPYTLVLADMDEGFRLFANLAGATESDIAIGATVTVVFDDVEEDLTLVRFTPATDTGGQS